MKRLPLRTRMAGFTLLEALLATLLMAIIMGALAVVTAQWLPNWNRGMVHLEQVEHFAAGLERMVADLAAAEIISRGGADDPPIFEGRELSVTFVRTAFGPNAVTGLEIVRLAEIGTARGLALMRTTAPFMPDNRQRAAPTPHFGAPVVLVRVPYRVAFAYAGADRVWRDTWTGARQLPRAVRVSVRDVGTARTLAVSTATVIRAEVPASCASARAAEECPVLRAAAVKPGNPDDARSPLRRVP